MESGRLRYTICFLRYEDQLLLLNRERPPNLGLWNGVGGKLRAGESPLACILREVAEETGIALARPRFAGVVTWGERYDEVQGGMYVFMADLPERSPAQPMVTPEGILAWKSLEWVLKPGNLGVTPSIPRFLPVILRDPVPYRHHCIYKGDLLRVCIRYPLATSDEAAFPIHGADLPS